MSLKPYKKPPLTYLEQIKQLQDRGLNIDNLQRPTHLLESISYYRLSGYWYPLLSDKAAHLFKPDANFDTAFSLYCFDRELRVLIMRELEKIEVSIRAKMIYVLSHQFGAFWYQEPQLFKSHISHSKNLGKLEEEYKRSDAEFIDAYRKKYSNTLPPSWMLLELTSFGTLSSLYTNLKPNRAKRIIANHFGLNEATFASWMHSIVYLRNVCAHRSRLWNRVMRIQPIKPNHPIKPWLQNQHVSNDKTFYILSMILYFLQTINPNNSFSYRFRELLKKYPNIHLKAMGFPEGWNAEKLWK